MFFEQQKELLMKTVYVYLCRDMENSLLGKKKFFLVKPFLSEPLGITCYLTKRHRKKNISQDNICYFSFWASYNIQSLHRFPFDNNFLFHNFDLRNQISRERRFTVRFLAEEAYCLTLVFMFLLPWKLRGTPPQSDRHCNS